MKYLNNNKGLTLIEMLATITILFIIGGMVYAMLFQMFSNFNNSENRITARQEANLIIAHLTTIHEKSKRYELEHDSDHYFITEAFTETDSSTMKLGHEKYNYDLSVSYLDDDGTEVTKKLSDEPIEIDLTKTKFKSIDVLLTLSSSNDEFEVKTTLSRMTKAK